MRIVFPLVSFILFVGCGQTGTRSVARSSGPFAYSGQLTTGSATNVIPIQMGCAYTNEPCVAVKFCQPGTSNCTTISHVLLDTGSYGFRVFSSALGYLNLSQNVSGLAEVVHYADGSCDWGPVKVADIYLGGQKAPNVPIQVIDASYKSIPGSAGCTSPESDPQLSGFNAILGVGLWSNDCPNCVSSAPSGNYYNCSTGTCTPTSVSAANQVTNPIALLSSTYNNGILISLSAIGSNFGSNSVTGGATLGVDTISGYPSPGSPDGTNTANAPNMRAFPADSSLFFNTIYKGNLYSNSFIDTGSNFWNFSDNSITQCSDGFYCPVTNQNLTAIPGGGSAVSFSIGNASSVINSNPAYNNVGVYLDPSFDSFDWGIPFYFGRNVFHIIKGKTSINLGTGPAWGFVNP